METTTTIYGLPVSVNTQHNNAYGIEGYASLVSVGGLLPNRVSAVGRTAEDHKQQVRGYVRRKAIAIYEGRVVSPAYTPYSHT